MSWNLIISGGGGGGGEDFLVVVRFRMCNKIFGRKILVYNDSVQSLFNSQVKCLTRYEKYRNE